MITVKKISVSSAQALTWNTVPILLIAAPPAGYANNILGASVRIIYNTITYGVATTIQVYDTTSIYSQIYATPGIINGIISRRIPMQKTNHLNTPSSVEQAVYCNTDAQPTLGNSTFEILIIYETKLIS